MLEYTKRISIFLFGKVYSYCTVEFWPLSATFCPSTYTCPPLIRPCATTVSVSPGR